MDQNGLREKTLIQLILFELFVNSHEN